MSRKMCAFALMVLTLALTLVPGVYAVYPLDDLEVVQPLPENMFAGSSYDMVILFDNVAKESVPLTINVAVSCEEPGYDTVGILIKVELNGAFLDCIEAEPGLFISEGVLAATSHNTLIIFVSTVPNLMPGAYTFEVDLLGEKIEPEPGPPHIIGRPNAKPKANAGPNQKSWTNMTVFFNGSKSEDPDGTIENYEWDFGDGTPSASGVAVEHDYSEPGQYTVTLTVRDNRWAYDSDTCKVKLSDPPAPVSNQFVERVHKREHFVDAMDDANTTVTLNTTDQVTVMVLRYEDNPYPEDPIPAMALPNYVDVEVSDPDAVVWPIYVEMFYTDEEVEGLDESTFGIYYWDGAWQRCSDTGVDTVLNVVWAYMTAEEASGSPIVIAGMHEIIVPPLPPYLDNLVITPEVVELGGYVTISFDIRNMDSQPIEYGVDIYIGNVNITRIWVQLGSYESLKVLHAQLMDTVGEFNVTVAGLTGSFEVKAAPLPAEFVVSELEITPEEVEEGEAVTVSVDVTNVGETEGSYTVEFKVDGETVETETVTLAAGSSYRARTYFEALSAGTYQVEVDGLTGSFTVKAIPSAGFVLSDLTIAPEEIELGEEVTVSFVIRNADSRYFVYVPYVQIGDTMIMDGVELEGHESRTVSHTMIPENVGEYEVEVDGLTGSFTVNPVVPIWLRPGTIAGILIVIVGAGAIIYTLRRRQVVTE